MDHREKAYRQFKIQFDRGLQEVSEIDEKLLTARERNLAVNSACAAVIDRLLETKFGRKLAADHDLVRVYLNLEDGLVKIANELRDVPPSEPIRLAISWADLCAEERKFKFLGGIGRIFHYFRDRSPDDRPPFDTLHEEAARQSLRDAATGVINQADSLLFHITAELMYDGEVVAAIRQLSEHAFQLRAMLAKLPVDRRNGPNPFHDGGETIIVRQFSQAVCLLCFELYGWINPTLLTALLEMKASTAEAYGMPQWLIDAAGVPLNREHRLRKFITAALKGARKKTQHPDWRTHEMIAFYSKNRKRFVEQDGLTARLNEAAG